MTIQQIIDRSTNLQNSTQLKEFDSFCIEAIKSIAQNNTTNANWQNYTEVTVNSTFLQSIGTSPRTILPALNNGEFYTYYGQLIYNVGTLNQLDLSNDNLFIGDFNMLSGTTIAPQILGYSSVTEFSSLCLTNGTILNDSSVNVVSYGVQPNGQAIKLGTLTNSDPTPNDFNGNIKIKIWYNINEI